MVPQIHLPMLGVAGMGPVSGMRCLPVVDVIESHTTTRTTPEIPSPISSSTFFRVWNAAIGIREAIAHADAYAVALCVSSSRSQESSCRARLMRCA